MTQRKWTSSKDYKENYMEILTENLLPLRIKAGITQEDLANIVGISRQTYYALETGKKAMTWNKYMALLFFFDTNVDTHVMLRDINAYPTELMKMMSKIE